MNRFHPARPASVYASTESWKLNAYLHFLYLRGERMRRSTERVLEDMAAFGVDVQPLLERSRTPSQLDQAYPWLKTSWKGA